MLNIGPYSLPAGALLAPMAGVTDKPFRQLCRRLGASLAVSEMVSANPRLRSTRKSSLRTDHRGEAEPISVQIAGSDPDQLAEFAAYNVDQGAQIIDINMGCPAKKVCNKLAGSALLSDEALVTRILDAVVARCPVPVTLKIRTGPSPDNRNAVRIARIAEDAGIAALTIHGRTRACAFRGEAEYQTIRAVKRSVRLPIIANGDITTAAEAIEVLDSTGADAIMIGRAAQGNPWIFRSIAATLNGQKDPGPPMLAEVRDTLLDHLSNLYAFYGDEHGVRVARKHIGWYLSHIKHKGRIWEQINQVESAASQYDALRTYFDEIISEHNRAA